MNILRTLLVPLFYYPFNRDINACVNRPELQKYLRWRRLAEIVLPHFLLMFSLHSSSLFNLFATQRYAGLYTQTGSRSRPQVTSPSGIIITHRQYDYHFPICVLFIFHTRLIVCLRKYLIAHIFAGFVSGMRQVLSHAQRGTVVPTRFAFHDWATAFRASVGNLSSINVVANILRCWTVI